MSNLAVKDMFWTLQGEGTYTGVPCLFLRLAGCSTKCKWCDTDWLRGESMGFQGIISALRNQQRSYNLASYQTRHLVITGGEPLDQRNLLLFTQQCQVLQDYDVVQIETSVPKGFSDLIKPYKGEIQTDHLFFTCSPKLFHPKFEEMLFNSVELINGFNGEVKIVIDSLDSIDRLNNVAHYFSCIKKNFNLSYMLEDSLLAKYQETDEAALFVTSIINRLDTQLRRIGVKFSPRFHNQLQIK